MANHRGSEGVVKNGANTIAEITGWSLSTTANTINDTLMADTWDTYQVGTLGWSGSLTGFWDETDTNGQVAFQEGDSVTLNLYAEGDGAGDTYFTGAVIVTGVEYGSGVNGMVTWSASFQGSGALSITTV